MDAIVKCSKQKVSRDQRSEIICDVRHLIGVVSISAMWPVLSQ